MDFRHRVGDLLTDAGHTGQVHPAACEPGLEARQKLIEQNIADADEAKQKARQLEEQQQKTLEQGRADARALKDEATKIGEQLREELRKQGEEEYRRLVERASQDIDASARRAAEELRAQVAGLVMVVTERVLGEGITIPGQEQLVDRAIAEIERQGSADGGSAGSQSRGSAGAGAKGRLRRASGDESRRVSAFAADIGPMVAPLCGSHGPYASTSPGWQVPVGV